MAHDEDRRWRERMWRDDDRRYGSGARYGEYRGEGRRRGWSEGSEWRSPDRGEWSSGSPDSSYGARRGDWDDRFGSNREEASWRDFDRGHEHASEHGSEHGGFSRHRFGRDMGQSGWSRGGHDRRQDRDYGGSMRAGEYGSEMGGARASSFGARAGGGYGGSMGSQGWSGREYDQYAGMSSEPGFGAGYNPGPYRTARDMGYGYGGAHDWGGPNRGERGFWDKAADEVSSWFGDEDAERRREIDHHHTGRGPRNYARSDSRINEDVCDRLTDHPMIDASDIEVVVSGREVTLSGTVPTREEKRRAEDIAETVSGVTHVQNNLRVKQYGETTVERTLDSFANATSGAFGERGGSTMSSRTDSSTSDTSKTTTGSSPGVMRSDPGAASTKGA